MKFLEFNDFETEDINKYIEEAEERLKDQYDYNKEVFKYPYNIHRGIDYYIDEITGSDIDEALDTLGKFYRDHDLKHQIGFERLLEDILCKLNLSYIGCTSLPEKKVKLRELYEFFKLNCLVFSFPYVKLLEFLL